MIPLFVEVIVTVWQATRAWAVGKTGRGAGVGDQWVNQETELGDHTIGLSCQFQFEIEMGEGLLEVLLAMPLSLKLA